jgi:hypothetical protein
MDDWRKRLVQKLEPILSEPDPRVHISAYHDMPYAIFPYTPADELEVRCEIRLLETRLVQKGKRVHRISLAECLQQAIDEEGPLEALVAAEKQQGTAAVVETIHEILAHYRPLVDLVAERLPSGADPLRDIVFITRTGALFPMYRTFSLLEQLKGRMPVPAILFYPGTLDGPAGLRFMGVMDAEHNYRPKIL